jgi:hypothetical protein
VTRNVQGEHEFLELKEVDEVLCGDGHIIEAAGEELVAVDFFAQQC